MRESIAGLGAIAADTVSVKYMILMGACLCLAAGLRAQPASFAWGGYGHDAQHSGLSTIGAQRLEKIKWNTPVDLVLQGSSGPLYIHYGSPLITAANTVLVPVRTSSSNTYRVEAHSGPTGTLLYTLFTDYTPPPHNWIPSYGAVLSQGTRVYYPGAGGTVYYRDLPDSATGPSGQIAFYGNALYTANQAAFDGTVMISTPITADSAGNIYFGFVVTGSNPGNLSSGLARIGADGTGSWISASAAAQGDVSILEVAMNCAPAVSNDGTTLYFGVSHGNSTFGYLVAVASATLAPLARVRLEDPETHADAMILDDSSASPTVGPDGDVYYGVFESSCCTNDDRGWLLHFDKTLTQTKTPGLFGWDTTATVVPASVVSSYRGSSSYLLFTKYNNYINTGPGGNGQNKIAVLDPNNQETDPVTGVTVMLEILTMLGPTPSAMGGVREWCINSGAIDPFSGAAIANSEDGVVYRWNLATNSFTQQVRLTSGVGEAYTPSLIGADGAAYAINDATLFAVGQASSPNISWSTPTNFLAGQIGASYLLLVNNQGSEATNGAVVVNTALPPSLTAISIAGPGWNCTQPAGPCMRSDSLSAGATWPAITLVVNVAANAPSAVISSASVSSDGAANSVNSSANILTTITQPAIAVSGLAGGVAPFTYTLGAPGTAPSSQAAQLSVNALPAGQTGIPFTATPAVGTGPANWLFLALNSGTAGIGAVSGSLTTSGAANVLTISVNPAVLTSLNTPNATYSASVTLSSSLVSITPVVIPVILNVQGVVIAFSDGTDSGVTCGPANAAHETSCTAAATFTIGQTKALPAQFNPVITLQSSSSDSVTLSSSVPWLVPSPAAPSSLTAPLTVSIVPNLVSPLAPGVVTGAVTAQDTSGSVSATFTVNLTVTNAPTITMTPIPAATVAYGSANFTVSTNAGLSSAPPGTTSLPVTCSISGATWLTAATGNPTSLTTTPAAFSFTIALTGVAPGSYNGTITCATPSGITPALSNSVSVSLTVNGSLTVTPTSASLGNYFRGTSPFNMNFSAASNPPGIAVAISSSATWLTTPASATTPAMTGANLQPNDPAIINAAGGTVLTASITVTAPQSVLNCAASAVSGSLCTATISPITVTIDNPPALTLAPPSLVFDLPTGNATASQTVAVTGSPALAAPVTAAPVTNNSAGPQWITATSGTTPYTSQIIVSSTNLTPGVYAGSVDYAVGYESRTAVLPVVLNVGQLSVTGGPVSFQYFLGAAGSPATATLNVSAGSAAINWVAAAPVAQAGTPNCNWLTQSGSGGTTVRGGSSPVTLSYNVAALPNLNPASYQCTINYSASPAYGSIPPPIPVTVGLLVTNQPAIAITPLSQTVSTPLGSTDPISAAFPIAAADPYTTPPNTIPISVAPAPAGNGFRGNPPGVFTATLSSAATPSTLTISANPTGLAQGSYEGEFLVSSSSSAAAVTVSVILNVSQPCPDTLSATSFSLTNAVPASGTPQSAAESFLVTPGYQCGTFPWTATSNVSWLQILQGSGTGSQASAVLFTALSNPTTDACNGAFFCGGTQSRTGTITVTQSTGTTATVTVTQPGSTAPVQDREVTALYQSILGRDPDPGGYAFWTGPGAPAGVAALSQMTDDFLTSPEAFSSNFAAIAAYQAATGALPSYAQFASAVIALRISNQTLANLFITLIAPNSAYTAAALYQNLLGRAPTAAESSACVALPLCFESLIGYPANNTPVGAPDNEFQSTGAFANAASAAGDHTNGLYVAMLYFDILSRDPDPAGFRFWLGVANQGGAGILFQGAAGYPARLQLLGAAPPQGFLGSQEFQSLFQ